MNDQQSNNLPTRRYSKKSSFYINTKQEFFDENDELLSSALRKNKLYLAQPPRDKCKICQGMLGEAIDLKQHGVNYSFCSNCDHLNGRFDDTEQFTKLIYASEDGKDYAAAYIDQNFKKRVEDIYLPKVEFLQDQLEIKRPKLLDVGCGGGYFVYACRQRGIDARGIDVSRTMIDFGNMNISERMDVSPLMLVDEDSFYDQVRNTEASVVSTIGVIEHLRQPQRFFDAFKQSKAQYLYYSVPMYSASVVIENVFGDIFPRQLSGGHTHLFTEKSIEELNRQLNGQPKAEWRFGVDIMDFYRSVMIRLQGGDASEKMIKRFGAEFAPHIDALQSVLDQSHFCSEIHSIVKKCD